MVTDTGRPSQKTQRSRKGKKAWRKNIDLDGFEQDLDDDREAEIALGPQQALFTVDKKADDSSLSRAMKAEKKLKAHEILNARSAVPPLAAMHKRKEKSKSKPQKSVDELRRAAGLEADPQSKVSVERDGVLRTGQLADLWDDAAPTKGSKRRAPDAPLPGTKPVEIAAAGQSYNPALDAWRKTIIAAHAKAEKEEDKRRAVDEERARIDAVMAETEAKLNGEDDAEEPSGDESAESDTQIGKLSVNPPVEMRRKTRVQRNRERRHQEWRRELELLREKKRLLREISEPQLPQPAAKKTRRGPDLDEPRRAHSRATVVEAPLAVKLSDELDDSLRRLRPEGNLMVDRVRSLQARGIIDAKTPERKRKPKVRSVERWAFKDFI